MECLVQHECQDITADIDFSVGNDYVDRGGFGIIYSGQLLNGKVVVLKCLEVLTSQNWPQENYEDNLKVESDNREPIPPLLTRPFRVAYST